MTILRRALAVPILAVLLAACGSTATKTVTVTVTHTPLAAHACSPSDTTMSCVLQGVPVPPSIKTLPTGGYHGIDFAWSCPSPVGWDFGASYLSYDSTKNWTPACIHRWQSAGKKTIVVWETAANRAAQGYQAGVSDATTARSQAAALGNTVHAIYFAIDFDASGAQVKSYFQGVRSVLGARTGAYGGITPVCYLFGQGLINYGWQTYGWSNGQWCARAQVRQFLNSGAVDYNKALADDYGQWPQSVKPHPKPAPPSTIARQKRALAATVGALARVNRTRAILIQRRDWFAHAIATGQ